MNKIPLRYQISLQKSRPNPLHPLPKPRYSSKGWRILPLLGLALLLPNNHHALAAQSASIQNASITWMLSEGAVVDVGETSTFEQGTMTRDYTIEAKAVSADPSLIAEGVFKATMSVFSPSRDSTAQKVGNWYVRGKWSLSDINAAQGSNYRRAPGVVGGQLQMELPFNPALQSDDWSATLRVPQTTFEPISSANGRQPLRGEGVLLFDYKLDGELTLNLKLWPQI